MSDAICYIFPFHIFCSFSLGGVCVIIMQLDMSFFVYMVDNLR